MFHLCHPSINPVGGCIFSTLALAVVRIYPCERGPLCLLVSEWVWRVFCVARLWPSSPSAWTRGVQDCNESKHGAHSQRPIALGELGNTHTPSTQMRRLRSFCFATRRATELTGSRYILRPVEQLRLIIVSSCSCVHTCFFGGRACVGSQHGRRFANWRAY